MTKPSRAVDPVRASIERADILERIKRELGMAEQWDRQQTTHKAHSLEHACKAEALIELLEVDDCGSTGGYDKPRGQKGSLTMTLRERYDWLRFLPIGPSPEAQLRDLKTRMNALLGGEAAS